jgi:type II secretion system protein J
MISTRHNLRAVRGAGFTLIELVISLAMVAIIASILAAALQRAYRATSQAQAVVGPSGQAAIALELASTDLQDAIQPNVTIAAGVALAGNFEGTQSTDSRGHEADDIFFFSTADSPEHVDADGEIKQVEITVEQNQSTGEFVLVRRVLRNLLADVQPAPDEEILCRNVDSFTVQYFDGSNWNNTWDSTTEDNTLPAAVQFSLALDQTLPNGKTTTTTFTRVVPLSCSMAALDSTVNSGVSTSQ